jgi:hypothetical protein
MTGVDTIDTPVVFDMWSWSHFFAGALLFCILYLLFPQISDFLIFFLAFVIHMIYELKDYYFAYVHPTHFPKIDKHGYARRNSWYNSIGDQIAAMMGVLSVMTVGLKPNWTFLIVFSIIFGIQFWFTSTVSNTKDNQYQELLLKQK